MEAAPSANPRRDSTPIPPNYVSLRQLQELRLKEKEEQEKRRREEEAAAAAAAAAAAKREAEKAAMAPAIKREAARKAETKGRAVPWEASGVANERRRGGQAQGQGHQWVAVAQQAPATNPQPLVSGKGAAGKWEAAIGGGRFDKGPDDVADHAPRGGGKGTWKGKGKKKLAEASASSHGGKPAAEVVTASSRGGKLEKKSESKANVPGDQAAESSSSGGPVEPAEAAILSSRERFFSRRRRPTGAGGRSAEACAGFAPEKTAGPAPPRGVKSDDMGKPKPPAPRRADAVAAGDSPDGKKAAPAQAPLTAAVDSSSKPTSGGELRKTMEAKPGDPVEGQRRRPVVEVQAMVELNPRVARRSAGPWRSRGHEAAEQHGRVWVPKAAAAAAAATGSSAGAGL